MARRIVCRCRSRPSSPIHAMSAAYSRSSLRSKQPPPSARHVGPHGPEPSAPHGSGPQERICSSSCLSWLHLLKSWSLRQSRGGSVRHNAIVETLTNATKDVRTDLRTQTNRDIDAGPWCEGFYAALQDPIVAAGRTWKLIPLTTDRPCY